MSKISEKTIQDHLPETKSSGDTPVCSYLEGFLMLKGNISSDLDTHNEEESSYVTLSNGPFAYVVEPTIPDSDKYVHNLIDVYFVTPILCVQCEDYIWGTGKVGVKCSGKF
ncbi:hypothetical protein PV325_008857 [Microctonus aethiopoides]|nr:hypothetical protein PV325_008857 [Microctonus aethiopoides]